MSQNQQQQHDAPLDVNAAEDLTAEDIAAAEQEQAEGEDQVTALEAELAETKERALRALAETENLRRRAARETEEARRYAVTGFARELLEVADNLGRALQSVPEDVRSSDAVRPLIEGIELTERTLANCFQRNKIAKHAPEIGERFDHNRHQAMFEAESHDQAPGTITQVMQPGYVIADRLLRPAMVGVAKKPATPAADAQEGGEDLGQHVDKTA